MQSTPQTANTFTLLLVYLFSVVALSACQGNAAYQAYPGEPKSASEVATVKFPEALSLLYVDEQPSKVTLFTDTTAAQTLPGPHQFIFRYKIFWDVSSSESIKVTSQPFAVSFDTTAGNTFVISTTPIQTLEDAQAYAKNPSVTIVNQSTNESVAFEHKTQLEDKGFVASFVKSVTTPATASSAMPAGSTPAATADTGTTANAADQEQASEALDKLKHWWQNTAATQRQEFMQWVYEQKPDSTTVSNASANVASLEQASEPLDLLKYWWQNAAASQREEFMQWVYKQ
ncbi:DUF2057 family protein [Kaarinaea lacus]